MIETLFLMALGIGICVAALILRQRFASFQAQTPQAYSKVAPTFDLQKHLNGAMACDGVIYGPLGRVSSTFSADFNISWDGTSGIMDEAFRYNDGSTQNRQWMITMGQDARFTMTAADVPGGGTGVMSGHTILMKYAFSLPEESGGHVLNATDWMYLTPDGTIVNRSQFRKFGIKVAELIATIRPKGAA